MSGQELIEVIDKMVITRDHDQDSFENRVVIYATFTGHEAELQARMFGLQLRAAVMDSAKLAGIMGGGKHTTAEIEEALALRDAFRTVFKSAGVE